MDYRRGWYKAEGDCWTKPSWSFGLKFSEGTEKNFFHVGDSSELQLQEIVQYVTTVTSIDGGSEGIAMVFKAMDLSKPSLVEAILIPGWKSSHGWILNPVDVECLARAIESGCLQSLKCLRLSYNRIGDRHVALAKAMTTGGLPALETLDLCDCSIGTREFEAYRIALKAGKLPNLSNLDIQLNEIGDEGAKSLGLAIQSGELKNLFNLDISDNDIGDEGAKSLGLAVQSGELKNLTVLDISGNRIVDDGLMALVDSFQKGPTSLLPNLRTWRLLNLAFTKVGLMSLGEALRAGKLPNLSKLDISSNQIGDEGAKYLGLVIRSGKLKNLADLSLWRSEITDDGLIALVDSFQEGLAGQLPNLSSLDLGANKFTEVGLLSLAEALKSGRLNSLKYLGFGKVIPSSLAKKVASALVSAYSSNNCLTVDVQFDWHWFPELQRRKDQLIERNSKNRDILAGLVEVPKVPAKFGKVYLCGSPEVGKTTLRRTFQRSFWKSLLTWQRRPHVEKRTRGIDVSQFSSKSNKRDGNSVTLLVWDMAGQEDFQLVHNAFFPDLSFAEGNATTFVVVCSSVNDLQESMADLDYWFRYIASSCDRTKQNPRHVFVVMNNIGGDRKLHGRAGKWKEFLEDQRKKFEQLLTVRTELFLVDVRTTEQVAGLKTCLLQHSSSVLRDKDVPELCQVIQENLAIWCQTRNRCPVLQWRTYVEEVANIENWPEIVIESATKYLNEAGILIFIDKEGVRLVVLDPNWFCREIVGKIFLSQGMESSKEPLFRDEVDKRSGSISIKNFKRFFKSFWGEWNDEEFEDLIATLLWLGLCYEGRDENVFIPALISEDGTAKDPWDEKSQSEHRENQWVMGFSLKHKDNEVTLAPISLWHRFQVDLAQTLRFNGERPDNDFVTDKHFMTFAVDHMFVLIQVDNRGKPTFEEITVLVQPIFQEELDPSERKQRQLNLASDLVEILLKHWNQLCPGIEYVHKVVWPWPARYPRPDKPDRNLKVEDVKKLVREHGLGTRMQWEVSPGSSITEDQLLSQRDKVDVVKAVEHNISILSQGMREAVDMGIFPPVVLTDGEHMRSPTHEKQDVMEKKLRKVLREELAEINKKLDNITDLVREKFKKQEQLLHKIQYIQSMFVQDTESTCPTLLYFRKSDSTWATLKEALSIAKTARLHFACEAKYSDCRPHADVKYQEGFDVSKLAPWVKTIVPYLKVSLTVLFISAKVAANIVAPGMGLIIPGFVDWQQATTLSEGLTFLTECSKDELDKYTVEGMGLNPNDPRLDPQRLYGESRKAISELIGRLKPGEFEKKIGLRKVALRDANGTPLHKVASSDPDGNPAVLWICSECFDGFSAAGRVLKQY